MAVLVSAVDDSSDTFTLSVSGVGIYWVSPSVLQYSTCSDIL